MSDAPGPLSATERDELERLRLTDARRRGGRGRRTGRWVGAVALLLVGTLLAVVAVLAVFVRNQLLDTDRYVATVAPLAHDPAVQDAVADRLTDEVVTRVDLKAIGDQAAAWLRKQGAPPAVGALVTPAVNGASSFVHKQIQAIVRSDAFDTAWTEANRAAHRNLVSVLTGSNDGVLRSSGTTVSVDVGALLATIRDKLVAQGFSLASRIPDVHVEFTVFSSPDLPKLRGYVTALDTVATWLPWAALVLLALAVLVAPGHRRAALLVGAFLAVGGLLLLVALAIARAYALNNLPPSVQSPAAVTHVLDAVLARVRATYRVYVVVGAVVAVLAWFAGPARPAAWTRTAVLRGLDAAGAGLARTGIPLGGVPAVLLRWHAPIDLALLVLAVAGLLLAGISAGAAVGFGIALLVAVLLVEVVARSARGRPVPAPAT
jgi:hypothetical protein